MKKKPLLHRIYLKIITVGAVIADLQRVVELQLPRTEDNDFYIDQINQSIEGWEDLQGLLEDCANEILKSKQKQKP